LNSEELAIPGSPKKVYGISRNFGNTTGVRGILKNKGAINDSQIDSTPIDKDALVQNWMTGELDKYKENQNMANILETKKHSKECINVAVIAKNIPDKVEEVTITKSEPTFSQMHLKPE
jgi:hypothetical protein